MIPLYTGSKTINYPISLTLAVLAGSLWIILTEREELQQRRIEAEGSKAPDPFIAAVTVLASGLFVARIVYIALHLDYYRLNLTESIFLWEGGLSGVGGGVGALIGLGLYTRYSDGDFWMLGDALAVPVQFALFGSWAGCWLEGCAYGVPTSANLFLLGTDPFGSSVQRWPTQGMGVIFSVISFAMLSWLGEQKTPSGLRLALSLTTGALSAAIVSLYRADPVLFIGPARLDTWGYALLTLVGLVMMGDRLYSFWKV